MQIFWSRGNTDVLAKVPPLREEAKRTIAGLFKEEGMAQGSQNPTDQDRPWDSSPGQLITCFDFKFTTETL